MARSVTLSQLLTRVRQRADLQSATARVTDQEIVDNLQEGIAELYDVVRGAFGQDQYRASYTFATSNGVALYALPIDFLSLLSVDVAVTPNVVLTARPYMENERNRYKFFPVGWIFNEPVYYRLAAANISFIPTPSGVFNVTLNYVPTSPVFTGATFDASGNLTAGGGIAIDGIGGWEEYAVLDAAIKCLIKDEDTDIVPVLEGRKSLIKARIESLAAERDAGQPERVKDVYVVDEYGWGRE